MKKKMRVNHFNRSLSLLLMLVFMLCTNRVWADDVTIDSNEQSILMPVNGTNYVTISEGVTSFHVYDDGGAEGEYSNYCNGIVVLTAPEGCKLQLTGTVLTEFYELDRLSVYDGNNTEGFPIIQIYSPSQDEVVDLGTITSTGRSLTLNFESDQSVVNAGLDLTVTVIPDESGSGEVTVNTYTSSFDDFDNDAIQVVTTEGKDWTLTSAPSGYLADGTLMKGTTKCVGFEVSSGTGTYTLSPAFPITGELSKITILVMSAENIVLNEADGTFVYDSTEGDFDKYVLTLTPGSGITLNDITFTSDNKWLFVQSITVETTTTGGGEKVQGEDKLIPATDSETYDIPEGIDWFKVYDNGGAEGEYSIGCDGSLVLTAPEGCTLQLTGSITTETDWDKLTVYDSDGTTKLLDGFSSERDPNTNEYLATDIGTITSTGRSMKLSFYSDGSNNAAGLDLTVTVIPDENGGESKVQGEDKLIPATDSETYDIPEGVDWFKVYDNGGAEGEYSIGCDGSLVLTAPEGCTLQLTGSITTETGWDKLTVYDSDGTTKLLDGFSSESDPNTNEYLATDIGTITSTGRSMKLSFYSDGSNNAAGLDLTVTVISDGGGDTPILDPEYTINVTQYQGGYVSVADNLEKAKAGDEINLFASAYSGNILSNLSVVDENGAPVSVNGGKWYNTTATFIMPASNVYITPQYTPASDVADNLYVNMEEYGSTSALIPSGVKSFKVYDDGGADGNYSDGFSSLTIFAPSGKTIQLTGNIATYYGDRLIVYEGNTDTKLADKRSETSGTLTDIGSVISTGRSIRLLFNTYTDKQYPGLDLTVKVIDLSLADNGTDNATTITEQSETDNINVALNGRTFYKDGLWNTICLPFDVTIANSPLAGATAKTLTNASMEKTHATLVFGDAVETLQAGVPYLIKWENNGSADIVNPVFTGVNITATTPQTITFADGCVRFIGYYDAFNITAANDDIYYMTGNNELKHTAKDRTLKAFRTYFQFKENNGGSSSDAKTFSFSYYFDDYATGISSVGDAGSDSRALDNNSWYTLDGRKLSGKPVQRGIYVNSGKKVLIK